MINGLSPHGSFDSGPVDRAARIGVLQVACRTGPNGEPLLDALVLTHEAELTTPDNRLTPARSILQARQRVPHRLIEAKS